MLGNAYYHRSFIILQTMDKGFGLTDRKEPAGYCKMEIRRNHGKMQVYVQDMKPAETLQGTYTVLLVSTHEGVKPVEIASLQVGSGGRGEADIAFDPNNMSDSGQPLDKFHALAVLFRPKAGGQEGVQLPLAGFSSQRSELSLNRKLLQRSMEVYAKSKALPAAGTEQGAESEKEQKKAALEEDAGGACSEAALVMMEASEEADAVPGMPKVQEEVLQPSESIEEEALAPDWEQELKALADQGGTSEDPGTYAYPGLEEDYNPEMLFGDNVQGQVPLEQAAPNENYWDQVKEYYLKLFEGHKKVCPFEDAVGEVEWIRVAQRGDILYPYYPAPAYGYRPHYPSPDHYLIGLWRQKGRVRYVVYGVPGIYSAVPPMSTHGFSRWLPVKSGRGTGYWLLYIDGVTGNIAYPY